MNDTSVVRGMLVRGMLVRGMLVRGMLVRGMLVSVVALSGLSVSRGEGASVGFQEVMAQTPVRATWPSAADGESAVEATEEPTDELVALPEVLRDGPLAGSGDSDLRFSPELESLQSVPMPPIALQSRLLLTLPTDTVRVLVNGVPQLTSGYQIALNVPSGVAHVEVVAAGYLPWQVHVTTPAGAVIGVTVPELTVAPSESAPPQPMRSVPENGFPYKTAAFVSAAAGTVSLVTAVALHWSATSAVDSINESCASNDQCRSGSDRALVLASYDRAQVLVGAARALYSLAAVGLASSGAFYLLAPDEDDMGPRLQASVSASGGWLGCDGTF